MWGLVGAFRNTKFHSLLEGGKGVLFGHLDLTSRSAPAELHILVGRRIRRLNYLFDLIF